MDMSTSSPYVPQNVLPPPNALFKRKHDNTGPSWGPRTQFAKHFHDTPPTIPAGANSTILPVNHAQQILQFQIQRVALLCGYPLAVQNNQHYYGMHCTLYSVSPQSCLISHACGSLPSTPEAAFVMSTTFHPSTSQRQYVCITQLSSFARSARVRYWHRAIDRTHCRVRSLCLCIQ
jgi:hypothetical protein